MTHDFEGALKRFDNYIKVYDYDPDLKTLFGCDIKEIQLALRIADRLQKTQNILLDEVWLPVVGYEGLYEVSSHGRVKSLYRVIKKRNGTEQPVSPRILSHVKVGKTQNPKYYGVQLSKNGKSKCVRIHKIVAEAFLGSRPKGYVVNHKDGDSFYNNINNLEYVTNRENVTHGINSEYTGVSYYKKTGKWRSSIYINGKHISLGLHNTQEQAASAYRGALEKYGIENKYAMSQQLFKEECEDANV